jgi:hypothetical protein
MKQTTRIMARRLPKRVNFVSVVQSEKRRPKRVTFAPVVPERNRYHDHHRNSSSQFAYHFVKMIRRIVTMIRNVFMACSFPG